MKPIAPHEFLLPEQARPRLTRRRFLAHGMAGFTLAGSGYSALGGALGALGAICIIWAFGNGGSPAYVMPIVFGLAPLVNVAVSMLSHPPRQTPNPLLWVGYALASAGVGLVFYFKPAG